MNTSPVKNVEKDPQEADTYSKLTFKEGDKVLCYHGPLIYFAKCLKARQDKKTKLVEYFIHYSGWNKSWDEWVPESRVLKVNEANIQKQKELYKAQKTELGKKNKKKKTTLLSTSMSNIDSLASTSYVNVSTGILNVSNSVDSFTNVSCNMHSSDDRNSLTSLQSSSISQTLQQELSFENPKKKKSRTSESGSSMDDIPKNVLSEDAPVPKEDAKFELPSDLKLILVHDWYMINKKNKLVDLPSVFTIDHILDDYVDFLKVKGALSSCVLEFSDGIKCIINYGQVLGQVLLYGVERDQYNQITSENPDTPLTRIYGIVHLLRFLEHFPRILRSCTRMDEKSWDSLAENFQEFMGFLRSNHDVLYDPNHIYTDMSPEYKRQLESKQDQST